MNKKILVTLKEFCKFLVGNVEPLAAGRRFSPIAGANNAQTEIHSPDGRARKPESRVAQENIYPVSTHVPRFVAR